MEQITDRNEKNLTKKLGGYLGSAAVLAGLYVASSHKEQTVENETRQLSLPTMESIEEEIADFDYDEAAGFYVGVVIGCDQDKYFENDLSLNDDAKRFIVVMTDTLAKDGIDLDEEPVQEALIKGMAFGLTEGSDHNSEVCFPVPASDEPLTT